MVSVLPDTVINGFWTISLSENQRYGYINNANASVMNQLSIVPLPFSKPIFFDMENLCMALYYHNKCRSRLRRKTIEKS